MIKRIDDGSDVDGDSRMMFTTARNIQTEKFLSRSRPTSHAESVHA